MKFLLVNTQARCTGKTVQHSYRMLCLNHFGKHVDEAFSITRDSVSISAAYRLLFGMSLPRSFDSWHSVSP